MDGEFVCENQFAAIRGIGGGNFMILGQDLDSTLAAAEAAANAARAVPDVILPFPLGVVRSGSKVGSQYPGLGTSTNHQFCPTLRNSITDSSLPERCACVYEIVIDGLNHEAVANAMRAGIRAACLPGVLEITAGSYGGMLGKHKFPLREMMQR
jgi:formylmethanofuran--tetrahydromethanopterin N-formyltransferase